MAGRGIPLTPYKETISRRSYLEGVKILLTNGDWHSSLDRSPPRQLSPQLKKSIFYSFFSFLAVKRSDFDGNCPDPAYDYSTSACCCDYGCCWDDCNYPYSEAYKCLPGSEYDPPLAQWIYIDSHSRYEAFYSFTPVGGSILT